MKAHLSKMGIICSSFKALLLILVVLKVEFAVKSYNP